MENLEERLLNHLELLSGERPDLAAEAGSALPYSCGSGMRFLPSPLWKEVSVGG